MGMENLAVIFVFGLDIAPGITYSNSAFESNTLFRCSFEIAGE